MAASCIVCFVGLPASGKTTFSLQLKDRLNQDIKHVNVFIVSIDSIISVEDQKKLVHLKKYDETYGQSVDCGEVENEDWKQLRQNTIAAVGLLLNEQYEKCSSEGVEKIVKKILRTNQIDCSKVASSEGQTRIFIVDDNLYYRSMRYEYFQLARQHRCGFMEIYLQCCVETAIKRNGTREDAVPEEVITNMASRLEDPTPSKYYWEENTIVIDSEKALTEHEILLSVDGIIRSLHNPYQPVENDLLDKEHSRMITSRNAIHQIDTILRQITSKIIKKRKDQQDGDSTNHQLREFSLHVNAARSNLLDDLRKGLVDFPEELLNLVELGQLEQRHEEVSDVLCTLLMKRINN